MTAALHPCKRFEWERIVRRCLIPRATKFVAFTLAQYGSANGDQIRPGVARLAAVCEMGESTVRKHLDALRKLGLVERGAAARPSWRAPTSSPWRQEPTPAGPERPPQASRARSGPPRRGR